MTGISQNLVTILIHISTMVNRLEEELRKNGSTLTYHSENTESKTQRENLENSKREKKIRHVQEHLSKINS